MAKAPRGIRFKPRFLGNVESVRLKRRLFGHFRSMSDIKCPKLIFEISCFRTLIKVLTSENSFEVQNNSLVIADYQSNSLCFHFVPRFSNNFSAGHPVSSEKLEEIQ